MKEQRRLIRTIVTICLPVVLFFSDPHATAIAVGDKVRVKELAAVAGMRNNPLLGYGLVVGLDSSGDKTSQIQFTEQSLRSMLSQYGVTIPSDTRIEPSNVAAVTVHATLSAFAKPGQTIDVTVSSLGNAKSLRGGSLLLTPLRGIDGQVYAIAQGDVVVSGVGAEGADGSSVTENVKSVGRVPNGATVERPVANGFGQQQQITLNLHRPDFTTASRVEIAINQVLGDRYARAQDAVSIVVKAPEKPEQQVAFVSLLENIEVTPAETSAKVVVNSRTGTIVIGKNVTVSAAAVSHGDLTVTIDENVNVDQPEPLAGGDTAITPDSDVNISEGEGNLTLIPKAVTLQEVVDSLNAVGTTTSDLITILEALEQAGALNGQLIII